jgi:hypothetical protein
MNTFCCMTFYPRRRTVLRDAVASLPASLGTRALATVATGIGA